MSDHAGVKGAARAAQRLGRLQHHGELCEVEAPDIDQRAGTGLRCDAACMGKGISLSRNRTNVNGGGK